MLYDKESIYTGDELLGPAVTPDVLEKAEGWLYVLAARLGVDKEEIQPSFLVQTLVAAYAYREVGYLKSGGAGRGAYTADEGEDYYGRKLAYYERRIKEIEHQITAADMTGHKAGAPGYGAVEIFRG